MKSQLRCYEAWIRHRKGANVLRFMEAVGFCFRLALESFIFAKEMLRFFAGLFTILKNCDIIETPEKLATVCVQPSEETKNLPLNQRFVDFCLGFLQTECERRKPLWIK